MPPFKQKLKVLQTFFMIKGNVTNLCYICMFLPKQDINLLYVKPRGDNLNDRLHTCTVTLPPLNIFFSIKLLQIWNSKNSIAYLLKIWRKINCQHKNQLHTKHWKTYQSLMFNKMLTYISMVYYMQKSLLNISV